MDRGTKPNPVTGWGVLPAVLLFTAVFLAPVVALFGKGLLGNEVSAALPAGYLTRVILFTYWQALLSTLLSLLLGGAAAFLLFETSSAWLPRLSRFSLLCFAMPSLLVVLSVLGVWGRSGGWNRLVGIPSLLAVDIYGLPGIVMANAFFNFPLFLLSIGLGLRGLDRRLEFCALGFGASRTYTFFHLTLPRLWPPLRSALVLCFLYSSATSFVVALFLGGGPQSTTLEVAIYQALRMDQDTAAAVRLALFSLSVSAGLYFFLRYFEWKGAGQETLSAAVTPLYFVRNRAGQGIFVFLVFTVFSAVVFAPLLCLLIEGVPALASMASADAVRSVVTSLVLALLAVAVTLPLAVIFAFAERSANSTFARGLWSFLPALPLAVSSLVLSVSLLNFYPQAMAALRGKLWPVAVVQALCALPLAYRVIRDSLFKIPEPLYVTARSLGATPVQIFWRVEMPLLVPALVTAVLLTMGLSLGEVAAPLLFSPGEVSTLSVEVFRSLQRYKFSEGFAYGLLLMALLTSVVGSTWLVRKAKWE